MSLHKSVLLKESIDGLDLHEGDVYLDATVGEGGHLLEVFRRWGQKVILAGIDADPESIRITEERLHSVGAEVKLATLNFRNIDKVSQILSISKPDKILFDLGWSARQFEEGDRGFSFQKDEPLLMTFSGESGEDKTTAYDVVNRWSEENLANIIYGYGEERFSRKIAQAIAERRKEKPIETSKELAEIIKNAVPVFYRFGRIHPATRTFQAIRIAVNDELETLKEGLSKGFEILKPQGRLAAISFHSLEDRIVKRFFKEKAEEDLSEILTKKPITPSQDEIEKNPRSRSAKLRILRKSQNKS